MIHNLHTWWLHLSRITDVDQPWCLVGEPVDDERSKMRQWRTFVDGYCSEATVVYVGQQPKPEIIDRMIGNCAPGQTICGVTEDFDALLQASVHKLQQVCAKPTIWWYQVKHKDVQDEKISKPQSTTKKSKKTAKKSPLQSGETPAEDASTGTGTE